MINVMQPTLGKEELEALEKTFKTNWLGKGKRVDEFETIYAKHLGVNKDNVITTNCCSEGLFSSMYLLSLPARFMISSRESATLNSSILEIT